MSHCSMNGNMGNVLVFHQDVQLDLVTVIKKLVIAHLCSFICCAY
jgi:hypothetical protein